MLRKLMSFLACLMLLISTLTWAQSKDFTISGEINFTEVGDIYIQLMTKKQYDENAQSIPSDLHFKLTEDQLKQKKVPFKFKNIPAGTYAIRSYQDVDGSGVLEIGMFGPEEPWGQSNLAVKPSFRSPEFDEVKFEVNQDITGMIIDVN